MRASTLIFLFVLAVTVVTAAPRPNIILIMADDMGYGDPSYRSQVVLNTDGTAHLDQGWIQTPAMDAMAASGICFDRFYSASAVCSPTRASCLTGRNPFRVGIPHANLGKIGADETPLSTILAAEGYATGHFGKWHLGTMTALRTDANRGRAGNLSEYSAPWHFDYDVCFATESKVPTYHPYRKATNGLDLPTEFENDPTIGYKIVDSNFYGTHFWEIPQNPETAAEGSVATLNQVNNANNGDASKLITDQAITFIQDAVAEGKPFFVVLWYHTPHKPLVDPDGISAVDSTDAAKDGIEDLDAAIGELRMALAEIPGSIKDDTMIWLTSDNGPENGVDSPSDNTSAEKARSIRSGGLRARKRSFYEGGIRVPSILEWPNGIVNHGRSTSFLSSTSDYYTTILDYLDLSTPMQKALDGISLRAVIEDQSETRSSPIGFLIGGVDSNQAWITQDYKLVQVGSDWELFDMTLPDHQLEITPLATESNVDSKSPEIQAIYNTMLADYTAWKATVDSDTPYISSAVPTVVLATSVTDADAAFPVSITFSTDIQGLSESDFSLTGGLASSLTGSGASYTLTVVPNFISDIKISLPEGAAFATSGHANSPSNELSISVLNKLVATIESIEVAFDSGTYKTVDSNNLSPAAGDNNVVKFSDAPVPFATDLYLRSSSTIAARQVRSLLQFDVSGLNLSDVGSATLHLHGYALNDINPVSLNAIAAAADWSTTPTYTIATQGSIVDGGDLITGINSDLARDYSLDVTEMVTAWVEGSWTNYGILLKLSNDTVNNGIGIQTAGENAPYLKIDNTQLKIVAQKIIPLSNNETGLSLVFQVSSDTTYYLQKSLNLNTNSWIDCASKSSENSFIDFYFPITPDAESKAFFLLSSESAE